MSRREKNTPFSTPCAECRKIFETGISTKLYCSTDCAKRAENRRRWDRKKQAKADAKLAATP